MVDSCEMQLLNPDYDFYTKDNKYRIHFERKEKDYSISEYGKYSCHMMIYNIPNQLILDIVMTEGELMSLLNALANIEEDGGSVYSDNVYIHPNSDNKSYIFNIVVDNMAVYPVDDNEYNTGVDLSMSILIYELDLLSHNKVLRLVINNLDIYYMEDLVYKGFSIIEDLPYVYTNLSNSTLIDFCLDE